MLRGHPSRAGLTGRELIAWDRIVVPIVAALRVSDGMSSFERLANALGVQSFRVPTLLSRASELLFLHEQLLITDKIARTARLNLDLLETLTRRP
jgi:hypothetical protein